MGLNLRPGGLLPKGFLLPANLAKVLAGLAGERRTRLGKIFLPPKPPPACRQASWQIRRGFPLACLRIFAAQSLQPACAHRCWNLRPALGDRSEYDRAGRSRSAAGRSGCSRGASRYGRAGRSRGASNLR